MATTDRLLSALETIVHALTRRASMLGRFPSKIVGQSANLTLEVKPDPTDPDGSTSIAGTDGVPIRYGLPGFTAKVPIGTRGSLEYENGDPKKPVLTGWESGAVDEVKFDGGSQSVARTDDTVNAGYLVITPTGAVASYFPGTTVGQAAAMAAAALISGAVIAMTGGRITSGNAKLLA